MAGPLPPTPSPLNGPAITEKIFFSASLSPIATIASA